MPNPMMVSSFLSGLVSHIWQTTVFIGIVALLVLAMRKNRASVRHAMWFVASLKFVVPFSLLVVVGKAVGWPSSKPILPSTLNAIAFPEIIPVATTEPQTQESLTLVALIAGLIWLAGLMTLVVMWLRKWWRTSQAVRTSERLTTPVLPSLEATSGLADVRFSVSATTPAVFGLFHPTLLLPADIDERLSPKELAAILAHERAHVRRRDNLITAFHALLTAVFWFHPCV